MQFRILNKELIFFFVAGLSAVFVDYFLYKITLDFLGLFLSKIFGFYSGVLVSFLINSSYTFKKKGKKFLSSIYLYRYLIVLTISMSINVLTNYLILKNFSFVSQVNFVAFLIATIFSMIFNFMTLKFIVFI